MRYIQCESRKDNHAELQRQPIDPIVNDVRFERTWNLNLHALKSDKQRLITDQRAGIATAELVDTIDAADQYEDDG